MKNIIKSCLFLLLFVPLIVNAKQCTIVSGNGKEIGSEIACGSEHFYVLENNNNKIRMLSKYNLNVGDKIDVFDIPEEDRTVFNWEEHLSGKEHLECLNYAKTHGYPDAYYGYATNIISNGLNDNRVATCRVYEQMNEEHTLQDSRAIGTKLDGNGKSILPLYGITYMVPEWGPDGDAYGNEYDEQGNLITTYEYEEENGTKVKENTYFGRYLESYKEELNSQEYSVDDVSFIGLKNTLDLLKKVSGQNIDVVLTYDDSFLGKMDIKDYVPEQYSWIYSITYWLGSGFNLTVDQWQQTQQGSQYNDYFISNEGLLCAIGRGECSYFEYPIGNGVRPMVTIPLTAIYNEYNIEKEVEGKGNIEVVNKAFADDKITFRVETQPNYKIGSITIIDKSGNSVTFKEDELIQNEDGTISVNSFTMPSNDVKIIAKFESVVVAAVEEVLVNPKTGVFSPLYIMLGTLAISGIAFYFLKKKSVMGFN